MRRIFSLPRELITIIGSPEASRFSTVFLFGIFYLIFGFIAPHDEMTDTYFVYPYSDTGLLVGFLILVPITGRFIHRKARESNRAPLTFLTWMLAAPAAVAISLFSISVLSGQPVVPERIASFAFDSIASFMNITSYSIVIASLVRYFKASQSLGREYSRLQRFQEGLEQQLEEVRNRYQEQVRSQIEPVLNQISEAVQNSDASNAMNNARQAIEEIVLPLNQQIASSPVAVFNELPDLADSNLLRASKPKMVDSRFVLAEAFLPLPTAIIFAASLIGTFSFFLGEMGFVVALLSLASLFVIQSILVLTLRRLRVGPLFSLITIVLVAPSASAVAVTVGSLVLAEPPIEILTYLAVGVSLAVLAFGLFQLSIKFAASRIEQREQYNAEFSRLLRRRDSALRTLRSRVSTTIHADIQGKLRAVLLRIKTGGLKPDNMQAVAADLKHVESVLANLGREEPLSFEQELEVLVEFWSGVCEIKASVSDLAKERLAKDRLLAKSVADVLGEAVGNAVKHAEAEKAEISIELEQDLLKLRVESPVASSVAESSSGGGGGRLFDEVCESWSLTSANSIVRFEGSLRS